MKQAGQIALTPFPFTDLSGAKLRPVLLLRPASGRFGNDWLVCMVSSQIHQADENLDEVLGPSDADYRNSGLKAPSVLRPSRLAVLDAALFVGSIGTIGDSRFSGIKNRLARWIAEDYE